MANSVKYNTSAESLALNTGYFWIGTGDVAKGPTSVNGFYSAINPSNIDNDFADGYTIYQNKASQGPSIMVASDDAELITITNKIFGSVFTTVAECLDAWVKDTDGFVLNSYINPIITDGLVLALDAGLVPSYPRSGTNWLDLSSEDNDGTLENGPTFNSNGYLEFDGDNDYVKISTYTFGNGNWTVNALVAADTVQEHNLVSNTSGGPVTNAFGFDNSKIHYRNYDGAWQNHDGNTTLTTGQWYMLTWVNYAGASAADGTMKMYVNGIADSSVFNSYTVNGGPCDAIGRNWGSTEYDGKIANIQFYSKPLTDEEISQNYYQAPIVTDGLVYAIDPGNLVSYENGSTTAYSLTGSLSGALTNGVAYNGSTGGTWDFDGVDDYIEIPYDSYWDTNVFGEAENFTIMCWTKCNNFYNWSSMIEKDNGGYYSESEGASLWANVSGFQAVFGNGVPGNPSGWGFNIQYSTSNTTDWFHVAFTGDGTTGRFYVNGDEVSNRLLSVRSATVVTTTNPPKIGVRGSTSNYEGQISTTLLYDRGLTAEEVAQNYEAGKGRFSNVSIAPQA